MYNSLDPDHCASHAAQLQLTFILYTTDIDRSMISFVNAGLSKEGQTLCSQTAVVNPHEELEAMHVVFPPIKEPLKLSFWAV